MKKKKDTTHRVTRLEKNPKDIVMILLLISGRRSLVTGLRRLMLSVDGEDGDFPSFF